MHEFVALLVLEPFEHRKINDPQEGKLRRVEQVLAFRELQAQIEGTENRITVARQRFIEAVRQYNITVRSFPSNLTAWMFGYSTKPSFTVENEAAVAEPPKVEF